MSAEAPSACFATLRCEATANFDVAKCQVRDLRAARLFAHVDSALGGLRRCVQQPSVFGFALQRLQQHPGGSPAITSLREVRLNIAEDEHACLSSRDGRPYKYVAGFKAGKLYTISLDMSWVPFRAAD